MKIPWMQDSQTRAPDYNFVVKKCRSEGSDHFRWTQGTLDAHTKRDGKTFSHFPVRYIQLLMKDSFLSEIIEVKHLTRYAQIIQHLFDSL